MTQVEVQWRSSTEDIRHNKATEAETGRHNLSVEQETHRNNLVNEGIGWMNAESNRISANASATHARAAMIQAENAAQTGILQRQKLTEEITNQQLQNRDLENIIQVKENPTLADPNSYYFRQYVTDATLNTNAKRLDNANTTADTELKMAQTNKADADAKLSGQRAEYQRMMNVLANPQANINNPEFWGLELGNVLNLLPNLAGSFGKAFGSGFAANLP